MHVPDQHSLQLQTGHQAIPSRANARDLDRAIQHMARYTRYRRLVMVDVGKYDVAQAEKQPAKSKIKNRGSDRQPIQRSARQVSERH